VYKIFLILIKIKKKMTNKSSLLSNFAHSGFIRDAGRVLTISDGIAVISGLTNVKSGEMV